jgi:hypothetical protein
MQHVQNIQYWYLLNKYLKCSVWRLAVRYDIYMYIYIYTYIYVYIYTYTYVVRRLKMS